MLTITNSVTPDKLNKRFQLQNQFQTPNSAAEIKDNQLLQTSDQMTRKKPSLYMQQGNELKRALLG